MTVIVAEKTPDAVRGMLKRWFIEPRPNVFVGTLNARTHQKTLEYILRNAPKEFSMLVISQSKNCQGYEVSVHGGKSSRKEVSISGLQLIAEKWIEEENLPF